MFKLLISFIFFLSYTLISVHVSLASNDENVNINPLQVGSDVSDNTDPESCIGKDITKHIEEKIQELPWGMKSIIWRDRIGILSGTTSTGLLKCLTGISSLCARNIFKPYGLLHTQFDVAMVSFATISISTGIVDLLMSGYPNYKIDTDLKDILRNRIHNINLKTPIDESNIDDFLKYAMGEYIDTYQKRGIFNRDKFIVSLNKY